MKKNTVLSLILIYFISPFVLWAQQSNEVVDEERAFRFMFYNVENYFDYMNDSVKLDDDFTPEGNYHWSIGKYKDKQRKIFQVIAAVGGWELPEIIGFCEIENRFVMDDLINSTPLKFHEYGLVHKESPDNRGIDVALLYKKSKFSLLNQEFLKVVFSFDTAAKTRDILYAKLLNKNDDTIHVFINHWPSRLGGQAQSEVRRNAVATILKNKVDSIFTKNKEANIIISGDFNDEPDNNSVIQVLGAQTQFDNPEYGKLYNLTWYLKTVKGLGSHKFQGQWGLIDQLIISGALLKNNLYTSKEKAQIFSADFLSENDDAFVGVKPFRTFIGFKFNGGFSDHYPIFLDFLFK